MPQTATATRADMADRNKNPRRTVPAAGGGQSVHLELRYEVDFKPEDLFDALEAKYGSGKVVSDLDSTAGNRFRLRIKA